jgi:hypothetical protein
MRWLKEDDACTNNFHLLSNQRMRTNHIASLLVEGVTLVSEVDKAATAFRYPMKPFSGLSCLEVPLCILVSWDFRAWTSQTSVILLLKRCGSPSRTYPWIRCRAWMVPLVISTCHLNLSLRITWFRPFRPFLLWIAGAPTT